MAMIKCKMCGGDLNIVHGSSTAECEYCGSLQTIPKADDEKKLSLFGRAHRLRYACDFDKAAGIYESIVADFPEEAEAYWGLVLCKYGIEYVDDPASEKKIPTCHRSGYDSVLEDLNFEQALENADISAQKVYREEAKQFERLRKGILEVSSTEEPYDIFICYKETDENGNRTLDSVLAQDLYSALTDKGYRVFFSRISLKNQLGEAYEPYIFAALHSAKVMLAVGTCYEYYNAVWVKNEWSRYLKLCQTDKSKHLIPCYKAIDPEDMPRAFSHLQGADLSKMGAIQDILFNMEKYIPLTEAPKIYTPATNQPSTANYIKRGTMALEDGNFDSAGKFFEDALNLDAECSEAYFGLAMCSKKVCTLEALVAQIDWNDSNYRRGKQFAAKDLLQKLELWEQDQANTQRLRAEHEKEERRKTVANLEKFRTKCNKAATLFAVGAYHTIAVQTDGTALTTTNIGPAKTNFGQCNVENWRNLIAVSAGEHHSVGLRADGTVVAVGDNTYGQCNTDSWTDIVAIAAGDAHTVGLKADGTVVATPFQGNSQKNFGQCDVGNWQGIVSIFAKGHHTMGIAKDGRVMATGDRAKKVAGWTNIVSLSGTGLHTVGLRDDGTVVAVGINENGQCDVGSWTDIVFISAALRFTVGVKADGTVVTTKYIGKTDHYFGERDVYSWRSIIAVATRTYHTVGVSVDGFVMATGVNTCGQSNVSSWKLFDNINTLEQERETATAAREAKEQREKEVQQAMRRHALEARKSAEKREQERRERRAMGVCQYCGGAFKGLFTKKCTVCDNPKDY